MGPAIVRHTGADELMGPCGALARRCTSNKEASLSVLIACWNGRPGVPASGKYCGVGAGRT